MLLSLVDRFRDDPGAARPAADVDRQRLTRLGQLRGHIAHADSLVEHRRMRSGSDLAALENRHPLSRNRLLLHDERDELPLWALLLDPAQLLDARELLVDCADPA